MQLLFKFKSLPEDFQVQEVPLLPQLCDVTDANHTYIWLKKVGYTTFEAQREIQEFFHLLPQHVNAQGLKDEDGVTVQLISVTKILDRSLIADFNIQYGGNAKYLKIEQILGYGQHSFTPRALHGNTFTLVLRALTAEMAEKINHICNTNRLFSFVNYYDTQRFGLPCGPFNAHAIGEAIIQGDWQTALAEFAQTQNMTIELKTRFPHSISRETAREFFKHVDKKLISFLVSSHNSRVWNRLVSQRLQEIPHLKIKPLQEPNLGELYIPEITLGNFPTCLSAPAFLWKGEEKVISTVKTRTFLVSTSIYCFDPEPDELQADRSKLMMSFFLPTGSYATMLLKQLAASLI